jgi:hypothetical protein
MYSGDSLIKCIFLKLDNNLHCIQNKEILENFWVEREL